jgi:hypothetical protein
MKKFNPITWRAAKQKSSLNQLLSVLTAICFYYFAGAATVDGQSIQDLKTTYSGVKGDWHGFVRYDFIMDDDSLIVRSFTAPAGERFGIRPPAKGKHRCIIVAPKVPAEGNPWSWRGVYWDHQPQTEIELLNRGFHIVYISADQDLKPGKQWDAWYEYLTGTAGLSKKACFIGMSRGGEYSFIWATTHPDKVACLYTDNTGGNTGIMTGLPLLAKNDVPIFMICGSIDPILGKFSLAIENAYQQFGGRISIMIKEGFGHHPHSLLNPKIIADFIEQSFKEKQLSPPDFAGDRSVKSTYYSNSSLFKFFPEEKAYITCRGPVFTGGYDRYEIVLDKVEAFTTIIAPKIPAPGKPWVFRSDFVKPDATVDQALLAKGFHIVTGAVPYNSDGPVIAQWNLIYKHLTSHGFSAKPVMEGCGEAAGEAYAWAIENPDKVSCIYAENPVLHSNLAKIQPLDNLALLAKAGIPILHLCGSMDPFFSENTLEAEKKYKSTGGKMTVIVNKGAGHYPLSPGDPGKVIDFILKNVK